MAGDMSGTAQNSLPAPAAIMIADPLAKVGAAGAKNQDAVGGPPGRIHSRKRSKPFERPLRARAQCAHLKVIDD